MAQIILEVKEYEDLKLKAKYFDEYVKNNTVFMVEQYTEDSVSYSLYHARVYVADKSALLKLQSEVQDIIDKINNAKFAPVHGSWNEFKYQHYLEVRAYRKQKIKDLWAKLTGSLADSTKHPPTPPEGSVIHRP